MTDILLVEMPDSSSRRHLLRNCVFPHVFLLLSIEPYRESPQAKELEGAGGLGDCRVQERSGDGVPKEARSA